MSLGKFFSMTLLGTVVLGTLVVWTFPTSEDFYPDNPFWNGLKDFQQRFNITPVSSLRLIPKDANGAVLFLIPYTSPTQADIDRLRTFLNDGSTLVLADDYGSGNQVLESLGLPFRFSGAPLIDPVLNYRDQWFPLATDFNPSPLTKDVSALALNYATTLEGTGLTVAASSSPFSFLDMDYSGTPNAEETKGPFPIVGFAAVGGGHVVLISDPSIMINSMLDAKDNARFLSNLISTFGSSSQVLIVQSLLPQPQLIWAKSQLSNARGIIGQQGVLEVLTASLTVVLLFWLWRRSGGFR